jgi:tetratricopeptide (TPR) repeat protein
MHLETLQGEKMPASHAAARCAAAFAAALALAGPVLAAGGGGASASAPDVSHELAAAQLLIDRQDWAAAIGELERARRKDDRNAEVHNLLGYSLRQSGQLERAFEHYRLALRLDPNHLGAHEYIGEAYLIARRADKAREHLVALSRLCGGKCEQYQDLSKAIAAYDAGVPLAQSAR